MMDLGAHIGDIARRLLGEPNRALSTRHQLRFGNNGSVAVEIAGSKRGQWFDHEAEVGGGPWQLICMKGDIAEADIPAWLDRNLGIRIRRDDSFIDCTYDYCDEEGRLLFQVCRLYPKTFRQRRPDGIWKVAGIRQVPYHLCDLAAATKKANGSPPRVYVVEGEKDADRLAQWGVIATTNPGGAGKWRPEFNHYFAGCDVVIIPDNDPAGAAHAAAVAADLGSVAASVRVVELGGLPEKGDISNWIADGGSQSDLETLVELTEPLAPAEGQAVNPPEHDEHLQVHDAGDIDVTKIPPRGWLLGVTFCRKFISGLIGEGGVGKTAIRCVQYLAAASGRNLTEEHVHRRCRVLIVCLEDSLDEVKRRIGAAMLQHRVSPEDVKGWLFYCTPKGLKLLQNDPRGGRIIGQLHSELKAAIAELKIDIVAIDPFVKAHGVEENDNGAIDQVCIMLADLADEFDCAVDLVSHARKGQATPGDAERERGASSKKDAGRLMRTVTSMTTEEAETFGVTEQDRRALVRVDDAKVNLTPRSADATWFKLVSISLGNATQEYPHGDHVQTVERWKPPDTWAGLSHHVLNQILSDIEAGLADGNRYSDAPSVTDRAAWKVIIKHAPSKPEAAARKIIKTWVKNAVLIRHDYENPTTRKPVKGFRVDNAKRPS
jgi:hypothetical protein